MSKQNAVQDLLREHAGPMLSAVSSFDPEPRRAIMDDYRERTGAIFGDTEEGASLWIFARIVLGAAEVGEAEVLEMARRGSVEEWRDRLARGNARQSVTPGEPSPRRSPLDSAPWRRAFARLEAHARKAGGGHPAVVVRRKILRSVAAQWDNLRPLFERGAQVEGRLAAFCSSLLIEFEEAAERIAGTLYPEARADHADVGDETWHLSRYLGGLFLLAGAPGVPAWFTEAARAAEPGFSPWVEEMEQLREVLEWMEGEMYTDPDEAAEAAALARRVAGYVEEWAQEQEQTAGEEQEGGAQ